MKIKKITKLVGLPFEEFENYVSSGQIKLKEARLIPLLKTGDEQALTSIFMASLKLIREFRNKIFKDVKLKRNGRIYFFNEVSFEDIDKSSIFDGLICVVVKGVIVDAAILEVKNDKSKINEEQIYKYYKVALSLQIGKIITVSNEFVSDPSYSFVKIKNQSKKVSLFHLSWTYIQTIAQLLIFDNDENIEDEDQVDIMKEVLHYFGDERSGVNGFHQMSSEWVVVCDKIRDMSKPTSEELEGAVSSWHQEEVDMNLMLSRKLGIIVKGSSDNPVKRMKSDIKKLDKKNYLSSVFKVKGAVSNIHARADFERRIVQMSIEVTPPLNSGTIKRLNWLKNQLDKLSNSSLMEDVVIEASVKYHSTPIRFRYADYNDFYEYVNIKKQDITSFTVFVNSSFGGKFKQKKSFVTLIEKLLLDFYRDIVQHMKTWEAPAPTLEKKSKDLNED